MQPNLVVASGKRKGSKIPLPISLFLIGRDERCHLRSNSAVVSRLHCVIGPAPGGRLALRDLRSRNGTFVNGHRVQGTVRLQDGDELQIGRLRFQVEVPDRFVPIAKYRVDPRQLEWLLPDAQTGTAPSPVKAERGASDTAWLRPFDQVDRSAGAREAPGDAGGSATLTAGGLLKEMIGRAPSRQAKGEPGD
jgi:pSer/pThr/pTyr-binding forkhead associated (FHA) protein